VRKRVSHSTSDLGRNRSSKWGGEEREEEEVSDGSYGALYVMHHFAVAVWRGWFVSWLLGAYIGS